MNGSGTEQGVEQEPVQWVSIPEAAGRLNISERAIYKRCQTGSLPRRKGAGGQVEVGLSCSCPASEPGTKVQEPADKSSGTGHEPVQEPALERHVADLRAEVAYLRSELTAQREQHGQAESELRRLLLADRQEIARLREQLALSAAPGELAKVSEKAEPPRASENAPQGQAEAPPGPEVGTPGAAVAGAGQSLQEQERRDWWPWRWKRKGAAP